MAELDSTISRINKRLQTLQNDGSSLNQSVKKGGTYWNGVSYEAFKDGYDQYSKKLDKGKSQLSQIKSQLSSLQQAIQRAEEQKRREAAEKKNQTR